MLTGLKEQEIKRFFDDVLLGNWNNVFVTLDKTPALINLPDPIDKYTVLDFAVAQLQCCESSIKRSELNRVIENLQAKRAMQSIYLLFFTACGQKNMDTVRKYIEDGINPNVQDYLHPSRWTAFDYATFYNDQPTILLLKQKSGISSKKLGKQNHPLFLFPRLPPLAEVPTEVEVPAKVEVPDAILQPAVKPVVAYDDSDDDWALTGDKEMKRKEYFPSQTPAGRSKPPRAKPPIPPRPSDKPKKKRRGCTIS